METDFDKRAKACCEKEYDRLIDQLDVCDSKYKDPSDHHRCYRLVARRSGRRSKKCVIGD